MVQSKPYKTQSNSSFEGGVVLDNSGFGAWLVLVFACVVYYSIRWKSYTFPSPGAHLVHFLDGRCDLTTLLFRSGIVLTSGEELV